MCGPISSVFHEQSHFLRPIAIEPAQKTRINFATSRKISMIAVFWEKIHFRNESVGFVVVFVHSRIGASDKPLTAIDEHFESSMGETIKTI